MSAQVHQARAHRAVPTMQYAFHSKNILSRKIKPSREQVKRSLQEGVGANIQL